MAIDQTKGFDITFPDDYRVEELQGKRAHFEVTMLDLRERCCPRSTTSSPRASARWRPSTSCAPRSATRSPAAAQDEARHAFADRIIDFATAERRRSSCRR